MEDCKKPIEMFKSPSKYDGKPIRFLNKGDHYELIFMNDFRLKDGSPTTSGYDSAIADLFIDMKEADKSKEIHVFVGSFGGEVSLLSMILQNLKLFRHSVGISAGWACSCGWMLLFACDERYVSPFSENMFHDMSCFHFSKVKEIRNGNKFEEEWWNILVDLTCTKQFLTKEELKLAETSEVYLTGAELIKRGAAYDYADYSKRKIPLAQPDIYSVGETLYRRTADSYTAYRKISPVKKLSWEELVKEASK